MQATNCYCDDTYGAYGDSDVCNSMCYADYDQMTACGRSDAMTIIHSDPTEGQLKRNVRFQLNSLSEQSLCENAGRFQTTIP